MNYYTNDLIDALAGYATEEDYVYAVKLSWFDDEAGEYADTKPEKTFIFADCEPATLFAHDIAYSTKSEDHGNPKDVYVIRVPVVKVGDNGVIEMTEDAPFLFDYIGCDSYLKRDPIE